MPTQKKGVFHLSLQKKFFLLYFLSSTLLVIATWQVYLFTDSWQVTLAASTTLLLLFGIIYSLIAKKIIAPLHIFEQNLTDLIQGKAENPQEINSGDEFETLSKILSQMNINLKQSFEKMLNEKSGVHAEKEKIHIALETISDGVIALNKQHQIVLFNQAAQELTNFPSQYVFGKPIDQIIKVVEKNTELQFNTLCPNEDNTVCKKDKLKLIGNNKEVFISLSIYKVPTNQTVDLSYVLTIHDTTNETQLEQMQTDFVSMAAHELRTPLTSLNGYVSVFLDENKSKLDNDQLSLITQISNSSKHLTELVENLLSVSRIERGAFYINRQPTDWLEICNQVIKDLTAKAQTKHIELKFIPPTGQIPKLEVDKIRITEVLTNLVNNAIVYTPAGGTIQIWCEQKTPREVITHVQDTGIGISKEAISRLFTKFYRVQNQLEKNTTSSGNGLGLYISKAVIEMHKGRIWVESEVGKGSRFSFSLPVPQSSPVNLDFINTKL